MRILFISNYFPPEVNAPATRLFEHGRQWVKDGHEVEVLTSVPNFPEGKVYEGYLNAFCREETEGMDVARTPMYVTANKGTLKRTLSYISFMLSACWYARKTKKPDVVVATSPQFFAAIAGYIVARFKRVPFVLEIRDLWPESIVAVGAVKRNAIIRFFEKLELFLYRKADHIVVVTRSFKRFIEKKGIPSQKITVLMNGADLNTYKELLDQERLEALRQEFGLEGKFVAAYIGTIGMAHRADVLFEAAQRCEDPDVVFMIVGTGAERGKLEALQAEHNLPNFRLIDKQPKEMVPYLLALTDVSVVHLRASDLFKTVIPSKIFETMATKTPMVVGVEGETKEIVEEAEAGITIPPEDVEALIEAVLRLRNDKALYNHMAESGFAYLHANHDRMLLARRYATLLEKIAGNEPAKPSKMKPKKQILQNV